MCHDRHLQQFDLIKRPAAGASARDERHEANGETIDAPREHALGACSTRQSVVDIAGDEEAAAIFACDAPFAGAQTLFVLNQHR